MPTTTCANCRAEVGDAAFCPRCGRVVLSPQSADQSTDQSADESAGQGADQPADESLGQATGVAREEPTDTAERPAARRSVEPAPAASTPGPARFPLYADDLDVAAHSRPRADHTGHEEPSPAQRPAYAPAYLGEGDDGDRRGGAATWLPWVIVALVMVLVAAGGVWLLLSPGEDDTAADPPAASQSAPQDSGTAPSEEPPPSSEEPPTESSSAPTEPPPAGDPVDVASAATATAPRTAPPNVDAFGNRTTYVAANMLDGQADTCWRMAGDGTGAELTFQLAAPTAMTRVGLINGYAKNAVVGGRNLNWYIGNRRVLAAQWVFDDGTTVDQPLGATKQMQSIDLGGPVTTSTVTLRLSAVSAPGTGRSARDFTAVSEVTLVGTPAG
jgi:hypothetical protein